MTFAQGTFVPPGAESLVENTEYPWWDVGAPNGYEELGVEPEDCDVIYAYPWPGEESIIDALFARSASVGALLVTNHGVSGMRFLRKVNEANECELVGW